MFFTQLQAQREGIDQRFCIYTRRFKLKGRISFTITNGASSEKRQVKLTAQEENMLFYIYTFILVRQKTPKNETQ